MTQFLVSYKLKIPAAVVRNPFTMELTPPYSYISKTKLIHAENWHEVEDKLKNFHPLIDVVDIQNETL